MCTYFIVFILSLLLVICYYSLIITDQGSNPLGMCLFLGGLGGVGWGGVCGNLKINLVTLYFVMSLLTSCYCLYCVHIFS